MKTVLIIDGNLLAFKAYESFNRTGGGLLSTTDGIPTTVIYGLFNSFQAFVRKQKCIVDNTILCWDVGGGSKYRKSIFPYYKAGRDYRDMDDYFKEVDSAREYFDYFGVNQGICKGIEADDVIGWLACKFAKQMYQVIIFSDDKDYYQLTQDQRIKIYRPVKEEFIGYKRAFQEHGIKPKYIPKLDALTGQKKDNIPGACDLNEKGVMQMFGFGPAKALKLLKDNNFLLKSVGENLDEENKFQVQLKKNWKRVKTSYKLSIIRTKNKHYQKWELKLLNSVYKQALSNKTIVAKNIMQLTNNLEFKNINTIQILRNLGVNVKGKNELNKPKVKL